MNNYGGGMDRNEHAEGRTTNTMNLLPHASTFNGSQSGGDPSAVSDVPAGCRLLSKES
jgi:hypothetical protein